MKLYVHKIEPDITDSLFDRFLNFVSPEKSKRVASYTRKEDSLRSVSADVLARYALSKQLGIPPKELVFDYNEFGKPFLPDNRDVHFNVSHSGNLVVCGVSDSPLGVDVEKIKPLDISIARKFCTHDELEKLEQSRDPIKELIRLWSLKESYLKALGTGLSASLKSISFDIIGNVVNSNRLDWKFDLLNIMDGYVVSVCRR